MCGRFARFYSKKKIVDALDIDDVADFIPEPSYNITPNAWVASVIKHERKKLGALRWGLVPSWAKDETIAQNLINARVETCHEKPSFRESLKKRRCAVLGNGYYEWQQTDQGKTPHFIFSKASEIQVFAGLYDIWKNSNGEKIPTCTILTTTAAESINGIHHRMPVFLTNLSLDLWLNPGNFSHEKLPYILEEHQSMEFQAYPVTTKMNSPRYNKPDCIEPLKN